MGIVRSTTSLFPWLSPPPALSLSLFFLTLAPHLPTLHEHHHHHVPLPWLWRLPDGVHSQRAPRPSHQETHGRATVPVPLRPHLFEARQRAPARLDRAQRDARAQRRDDEAARLASASPAPSVLQQQQQAHMLGSPSSSPALRGSPAQSSPHAQLLQQQRPAVAANSWMPMERIEEVPASSTLAPGAATHLRKRAREDDDLAAVEHASKRFVVV